MAPAVTHQRDRREEQVPHAPPRPGEVETLSDRRAPHRALFRPLQTPYRLGGSYEIV